MVPAEEQTPAATKPVTAAIVSLTSFVQMPMPTSTSAAFPTAMQPVNAKPSVNKPTYSTASIHVSVSTVWLRKSS